MEYHGRSPRRHIWFAALALAGALALLTSVAAPGVTWADTGPAKATPRPQVVQAPNRDGVSALARPFAPFPGIYQFFDSDNVDPGQYPIVGGHTVLHWPYIEPQEGQIVWDRVERWIAAEAAKGKPVGIGFSTYNGMCCGGSAVPQWVYDQDPNARVICNGDWVVPKYWNETFLTKYANFIHALGQRYDGDPRIAWVEIGVGMYGETIPCENELDSCFQAAGLTSDLWVQTVNRITDEFRSAFPNTTLLLQMAPFFLSHHERKAFTDHAASLGVGLKHNGLRPDADALQCDDPLSTWYRSLQYDPMVVHGERVPVAWETYGYMLPGRAGRLWGILNALDKHSDYIVADKYITQEPAGFAYLEFANRYLGRTIEDTPSVWVALRETLPQYTWYPDWGNYSFWLYQVDEVPGGKTVPEWQVSNAPEGYYTRRTDQASGNPYMYFDVDDRYIYGGQNAVTVTVTYYDAGYDTWELQYDAVGNDYKSAGVVAKTNTGQWLKKVWVLTDAEFANGQAGGGTHVGTDFRIWCRNDGDDYFHMIDVARISTSGAPTIVEAGFRQGEYGYSGVQDTYISSWAPNTNYSAAGTFSARTGDVMHGLIQFDLSSIPAGARVLSAKLSVYATGRSNTNGAWLEAYQVLRPWTDTQATWNYAQNGSPWSVPGCAGIGSDREGQYLDRGPLPSDGVWTEIEIGRAVQEWLDDPSSNHGVLLRLTSNGSVQYDFASSQHADPSLRPRLVVRYAQPVGAPVPTATPTPTATGVPTAAPTPTPTPTAGTPPTATPTPSATRTPTATATDLPSTTVVLQQGMAGYTGTDDTFLSSWYPTRNYGSADYVGVRSLGVMGGLLRFDVSQVPADATVVDATLSVYVHHRSNANWMWLEAYDVYRSWVESQATWYQARTGENWGQPGCGDTSTDRAGTPTDRVFMQSDKMWYDLDITPLVQRWVQNPATNRGVFLRGDSSGSVQYDISSSEAENANLHPKLTIVYRTEGSGAATATPTPSPTATPTVTPTATWTATVPVSTVTPTATWTATVPAGGVQEVVLPVREDAYISQWYPTSNFGASTLVGIRPVDVSAALFAFDLTGLPMGVEVESAELELWVQRQSNIHSLTASVYRVLRPWEEGRTTWYQATGGTAWQVAGCNGAADREQVAADSLLLDGSGRWYSFNVTSIVQQWAQGEANYGLIVKASGKVSVQYDFASREWPDARYRPRLVVRYVGGGAATATPTPTPTATPTVTPTATVPVSTVTPTATWTATVPAGGVQEVVLPVREDAYISQWYPASNFGASTLVGIRPVDVSAALFAFDLTGLPMGVEVESAELELWVQRQSNIHSLTASVYRVLRPWEEGRTTWYQATGGTAWQVAGCNGTADREQVAADSLLLDGSGRWYSFNVTSIVQQWAQGEANYGLIVKASGKVSVQYDFASREWAEPARRPRLVVRYRGAGAATATPTPTASWTPTATATPTPTPTKPVPTATATATTQPGGAQEVVLGAVQDAYISQWYPTSNFGSNGLLGIRPEDVSAALFQFDLSALPAGVEVESAELELWVQRQSNIHSLTASVYRVLRPWEEGRTTWYQATGGTAWQVAGCNGAADREQVAADSLLLDGSGRWYSFNVTSIVQQWAQGEANYGLIVKASGKVSVQYDFASREWPDARYRPRLVVRYVGGGAATATPTPSPTATATRVPPTATPTSTATPGPGEVMEVTFQQGRNGYTGTRDTDIVQWYPDRNLGTATFVRIRSGDIEAGLIYFDVSSIPSTATIEEARLQMYVIQRSNANWTWPATYQMKRAWEEEQATWNQAADGVPWGAPGANDPLTDRWFTPTDLITMTAVNTWYEWDVTEMVQDWVFTPGANKGLTVRVVDHPETPVEYLFASSEYPTESLRPKLVVRYRLGDPPTPTPVPTNTPTPTPTPRLQATYTVTFQQGVDGYTGAEDTYISSYVPYWNYHLDHPLQIRTPDLIASMFRFDVSSIPQNAHVIQATLSLYAASRSNSGPLHAWVYPVLRPWVVDQVTWNGPASGQAWGEPGCNAVGLDRTEEPLDRRYVEFINMWYDWDVTEAVREWVRNPGANYGLILKAYGDVKVMYTFASGEDSVSIRPKLTVTYGIPVE